MVDNIISHNHVIVNSVFIIFFDRNRNMGKRSLSTVTWRGFSVRSVYFKDCVKQVMI